MRSNFTRLAAVADPHIGNHKLFGGETHGGLNWRCMMALKSLELAVDQAIIQECDAFVVLGDLFDSHRPSPPVIAAVQTIFSKFETGLGRHVFLIAGNHDKSSEDPGDNALAPLRPVATVIDSKPMMLDVSGSAVLLGPYRAEPATLWIREYLEMLDGSATKTLLATHVGLIDDHTPPWLRDAHDAVPASMFEKHHVMAGNWHAFNSFGVSGCQCGALTPTGFDNPEGPSSGFVRYGSMLVWEGRWLPRYVIDGPRFYVEHYVTEAALRKTPLGKPTSKIRYLKLRADVADVQEAQAVLDALKGEECIADGIVEPYVSDKERIRNAAVNAVLSSTTLDEALVAFLKKMPIPDGVSSSHVCELAREYIKKGQKRVSG